MIVPDVFLSYSHTDRAAVQRFAAAFEAEGLEVWWDNSLRSGESFDEKIEQALRQAKAVVVLWSKASVASRWVRAEATLADRNKTLVPVMIETCDRPIMFELTHTAELSHWTGDASDGPWQALLGDVRRHVGRDATRETSPTPSLQIAPQPLAAKPSIVVRPFATMAGAGEADYFADGMVVEIVSALSRFPSLFVIASGTSFNLRGDTRSSGAIARELGVRYVLQGSVRKSGAAIRIAVELLDGDGHTPIWTQRFDGVLDDVFALQDEIAGAVAARIDSSIQAHEMRQANTRLTNDQGAYDLFLRGSHNMWAKYEGAELREAISLFDQAIARDPRFALAMALCSNACLNLAQWSPGGEREALMEKCLSLAQRAVRTDRDDYRVITWVSYNLLQCGQPIATVNALIGQALEMNPGDSVTHFLSGWINVFAPNPMKALAAFETGLRLDPRSPWRVVFFAGQGIALFHLDRFEEAIPLLREAAEYSPSASSVFNTMQAAAYGFLGKTAQAQALDGVCYPLSARDEVYLDQVRDGSLKPKLLEGLRLAGIGVE